MTETAVRVRPCKTKTEREILESETGLRYSVVLRLPYYDGIRMRLIDPMHNLFLGKENFKFFKPSVLSLHLLQKFGIYIGFPHRQQESQLLLKEIIKLKGLIITF